MKRTLWALLLLFLMPALAAAREDRMVLIQVYQQVGWGDRMQVGCMDESGRLWKMAGSASTLKWPYDFDRQLEILNARTGLEQIGQLSWDDAADLQSLVLAVPRQDIVSRAMACDAGTQKCLAVRYDREGKAEAVCVAMTGDSEFENTDPNAQALFEQARKLFPFVTCYAGISGFSWGFAPVSLLSFLKNPVLPDGEMRVEAWKDDCEAGPIRQEVTPEEEKMLNRLLREARVTGKANAMSVTGGTTGVRFMDGEGKTVTTLTFYEGLLVRGDGMYRLEFP